MGKKKMDNKALKEQIERRMKELEDWEPGYYEKGFYFRAGIIEGLMMAYGQDGLSTEKLQRKFDECQDIDAEVAEIEAIEQELKGGQ